MGKGRLEAFSDGVIAIVITIMVLGLEPPKGNDLLSMGPLVGEFLSYVLSFVFLGIYWSNHHHLLHTLHRATGGVLWANLHLLFWLSLVPFATAWMGESGFGRDPVLVYGSIQLMSAIAYTVLARTIICSDGELSELRKAIGSDAKGKVSMGLYAVSLPLAFVHPLLSAAIYVGVAILWLVPDRRIERALHQGAR